MEAVLSPIAGADVRSLIISVPDSEEFLVSQDNSLILGIIGFVFRDFTIGDEKMARNISVSVIIPVYNVEQYVAECIESVLAQSLENIEIIIIDDCSTDRSLEICSDYAIKYAEKIKLISHEKNLGLSSARNTGANHSKGEYISFIDSDDYIGINRLKSMYEKCIKYDADIVICTQLPKDFPVTIHDGFFSDPQYSNVFLGNTIAYINPDGRFSNLSVNVWRRLYKRDFLLNNTIEFLKELRTAEDRLYTYETNLCARNTYFSHRQKMKNIIIDKELGLLHIHINQMTGRLDA